MRNDYFYGQILGGIYFLDITNILPFKKINYLKL